MKISLGYPPNMDRLRAAGYNPPPGSGIIYTYGDTIYNPDNVPVTPELISHETIHSRAQAALGIDAWWERWMEDPVFRAEQEAQAYGAQFAHYRRRQKDRNWQTKYLHSIAGHLCSGMYGLNMSHADARAAILKRAH